MTGTRDFDNIAASELSQTITLVADPSQELDRADGMATETTYQNDNWTLFNGFYRTYPEAKAQIDKMALWTVGKGYEVKKAVDKKKLDKIVGFGKDSFNSIMENLMKVKKINGDAYAHIIKDKSNRLINLKPLNPGAMKIIANDKGMIKRYEQTEVNTKKTIQSYDKEDILHLTNDREGDEIHGVSIFEALTSTLKNIKQLDNDMTMVFHRYVMPMMIFKLDTDDEAEIAKFKAKADAAIDAGQNLYIPKDAVDPDTFTIPQFSNLDPLLWRKEWISQMIKSVGIPELVLGSAEGQTEASSKIVYLAFQQTIEKEQRYLEEQLKLQLGIEVEFDFPARIEENLGEDEGKDGKINTSKKSEVKVTSVKEDGKAAPGNSSTEANL